MGSKLLSLVDGQTIVQWLIIAAFLIYFVYKEKPGFWERISRRVRGEQMNQSIITKMDRLELEVQDIKDRLTRDFRRIDNLETLQEADRKAMKEIKSEQGIIMRALLGALTGLQELGANGGTEEAKEEILNYLNEQAHNN